MQFTAQIMAKYVTAPDLKRKNLNSLKYLFLWLKNNAKNHHYFRLLKTLAK